MKCKLDNGLTANCFYGIDQAGNERVVTSNGVDLETWRAGNANTLIPPWILDRDLPDPTQWADLLKSVKAQGLMN